MKHECKKYDYIAVIGATATGKTRLAVKIAQLVDGEIISCDSRQVYRGMSIGTGKDINEYTTEQGTIPYHLIDILEPHEDYSVFQFLEDFYERYDEIVARGKIPILCGGTYMYFTALFLRYPMVKVDGLEEKTAALLKKDHQTLIAELRALNPQLHNRTDLVDKYKTAKALVIARESSEFEKINGVVHPPMEINPLIIATQVSKEEYYKRIRLRLAERLRNGLVDEVRALMGSGVPFERLEYFGLEYKYVGRYLLSQLNKNDMIQKLVSAINEYAKKQLTGIAKLERNNTPVNWVPTDDFSAAEKLVLEAGFKRAL